ncbi:MAG TPA: zinc-binding dehydrogenase [Enterococcus sp.]|nr:zinc-binding dehydrogenase [Enterococcus sp.]
MTYINVREIENQVAILKEAVDHQGYDDVFVMVPAADAITDGSKLMNPDGCLNFFAGPQNKDFFAEVNFYDVHYSFMHYVGTSGGNTEDMRKAVQLIEEQKIRAANIVTHVLGLDSVAETTLNQPTIGGGKILIRQWRLRS